MKRTGYIKTRVGVSAVQAKPSGAGTHGGGKRQRNRRDRKSAKLELRRY